MLTKVFSALMDLMNDPIDGAIVKILLQKRGIMETAEVPIQVKESSVLEEDTPEKIKQDVIKIMAERVPHSQNELVKTLAEMRGIHIRTMYKRYKRIEASLAGLVQFQIATVPRRLIRAKVTKFDTPIKPLRKFKKQAEGDIKQYDPQTLKLRKDISKILEKCGPVCQTQFLVALAKLRGISRSGAYLLICRKKHDIKDLLNFKSHSKFSELEKLLPLRTAINKVMAAGEPRSRNDLIKKLANMYGVSVPTMYNKFNKEEETVKDIVEFRRS